MGMTDPSAHAMIEKLIPGGLGALSAGALGALNPNALNSALNPSTWPNSALNPGLIQSANQIPGAHPYPQDLLVGQKDGIQKQSANQKPSIVSAPAAQSNPSLLSQAISSNQKQEIPKLTQKQTPTPKN